MNFKKSIWLVALQIVAITIPSIVTATTIQFNTTIDIGRFRRGICADDSVGNTEQDIRPEGVTIPSLWWTRDQLIDRDKFNPKLVEGWLVCDAGIQDQDARVCKLAPARPGRVDIVVNTQLWATLDYLKRFEFLNRLGTAASECGYNIYVFNTEAVLLGDYTCAFPDRPTECQLRTDLSGRSGLRRNVPDGF
jgi:hypothetical protein